MGTGFTESKLRCASSAWMVVSSRFKGPDVGVRGWGAREEHGTFQAQGRHYLNVGPLPSLLFKTLSVLQSYLENEEVDLGPGELLQTPPGLTERAETWLL